MPWIPDSKAQDPEFLHQNVQDSRFNRQNNFQDSGFGFPCMARALGFRQIHLRSFSSQRSRTITREYSQIISTSRWVKRVELYTSIYVDLYLSGWQRPITSAEREVKDSRRSGMYQSCNFLTRLGKQSLLVFGSIRLFDEVRAQLVRDISRSLRFL